MPEDQNAPAVDPFDALVGAIGESPEVDEQGDPVDAADEQHDAAEAEAEEGGEEATEGAEAEEAGEEVAEEAPKGRYKVAVQDESGKIVEQAVSFDELKAGYQRGQEVAAIKTQSEQHVAQVRQEAVQYVTEVAQKSQKTLGELNALVLQALEVVSPEDMLSLAQRDPNAYQQAAARQTVLQRVQAQIAQQNEQLSKDAQQAEQQKLYTKLQTSKSELAKAGITTEAVAKIYESAGKAYGYEPAELAGNLDHRLVLLLKDAAAYRAIQAKKPEVQNKVREAPKMPTARPKNTQSRSQELVKRLGNRGASRDDLAAFFASK